MKNKVSNGGVFFIYGVEGSIKIGTADKINVESESEEVEDGDESR